MSAELMFSDLEPMLKKLKKLSYEANMKKFRNEHGHFIDEMISRVATAENKDEAVAGVGSDLADDVFSAFSVNGKMRGRKQADLNFFMIYYVFPAILLTNDDRAKKLCDGIRDAWNKKFGQNINYTDYDSLYSTFRNKIFGIF